VALRILLDKLAVVFQTIEPTMGNQAAFGHLVRELLLIACMEVETTWSAVLRESGYPSSIDDKGLRKVARPYAS